MRKKRCSALPTFMACATSHQPPKTGKKQDSDNDLRKVGSCVHAAVAAELEGDEIDMEAICAVEHLDEANAGEVWKLVGMARRQCATIEAEILGRTPKATFVEQYSEVVVGGEILLTGTCDYGMDEIGIDWKSGYKIYEPRWQLNGYKRLHGFKRGVVGWLRDDVVDVYDDLLEANEFDEALMAQFALVGKSEVFGNHCFGCDRQHECETYKQHMSSAVTRVTSGEALGTIEDLVAAHPKVKLLEQAIKEYKSALRSALEQEGTLDLGDGTELYVMAMEKDGIDAKAAFKMATKYIDKDAFMSCLTVGKTKLLNAVKEKAPNKEKAKTARQFMKDLEADGAVKKRQVSQVRTRRITG